MRASLYWQCEKNINTFKMAEFQGKTNGWVEKILMPVCARGYPNSSAVKFAYKIGITHINRAYGARSVRVEENKQKFQDHQSSA